MGQKNKPNKPGQNKPSPAKVPAKATTPPQPTPTEAVTSENVPQAEPTPTPVEDTTPPVVNDNEPVKALTPAEQLKVGMSFESNDVELGKVKCVIEFVDDTYVTLVSTANIKVPKEEFVNNLEEDELNRLLNSLPSESEASQSPTDNGQPTTDNQKLEAGKSYRLKKNNLVLNVVSIEGELISYTIKDAAEPITTKLAHVLKLDPEEASPESIASESKEVWVKFQDGSRAAGKLFADKVEYIDHAGKPTVVSGDEFHHKVQRGIFVFQDK